ncbi:hypothetical protein [Ruegeria sp.]|uniref:hypothetical protein n=1 Tax=Ruegeria sp. TaxID=1879320 RepID=UPI003B006188
MSGTKTQETWLTCIAMRDNVVCENTTAANGAGVLCSEHLLLHQTGHHLRFKGDRTKTQQMILDALKCADDKVGKGKKEDTPFYLKPAAVLTAIFTVSLFCIERIQSLILCVPSSLTIGGYDMTAAAIQNAGLGLLVFAFAVLLLLLSASAVSAIYLGMVAAVSWGLTSIAFVNSCFFKFLARCFRAGKLNDIRAIEQVGQESWFKRAFEKFRTGLDCKQNNSRVNFEEKRDVARKNVKSVWKLIKCFWVWFWNGVICSDRSYPYTGFGQSILLITLCSTALIFAAEAAYDRDNLIRNIAKNANETRHDEPEIHGVADQTILECNAPDAPEISLTAGLAHGANQAIEEREFYPLTNFLYNNFLKLFGGPVLLEMVTSKPEPGMMTFARQPTAKATLLDVSSEKSGEHGFRTEKLIYIGDFGDWAFIARVEKPEERVLVRRSAIIEFSRASAAELISSGEKQDTPTTVSVGNGNRLDVALNFPHHVTQPEITTADVRDLEDRLLRLSSNISRNQAKLQMIATARQYRNPSQLDLAMVLEQLVKVQEGLARDTSQLREGQDWLSATFLGVSLRFHNLRNDFLRALANHRSVPPVDRFVPWKGVYGVIQDGVPTRTPGIINDIARSNGKGHLTGCASNQTQRLGFVDFREGVSNAPKNPSDIDSLVKKLQELREGDYTKNSKVGLIFLRGGASYTGMPEANIRISENRAELVKRRILLALSGRTHGDPTEIEREIQKSQRLTFIAFGVGERLHHTNHSSRAVEVILCKSAEQRDYTQSKTGRTR